MRILVRTAALAAVLGIYFGIAMLPKLSGFAVVGLIEFIVVGVGAFVWAMRDGREIQAADAVRDWLVVAFVGAVIWMLSQELAAGTKDLAGELRTNFSTLLVTFGLIFAPALLGVILGRRSRPVWQPRDRPSAVDDAADDAVDDQA